MWSSLQSVARPLCESDKCVNYKLYPVGSVRAFLGRGVMSLPLPNRLPDSRSDFPSSLFPAWTRSAPLDDNVHDGLVCEAVVAEDLAIAQVDQPCAVKVLRALLAACRNEAAALSD